MIALELKRLGRNMLIYGGGDVVVRFMSFFLLPLFTRYLTPADYGVRGLLLAVSAMLVPIFSLGLGAAVGPIYFEGNQPERKAGTIWTATGLLFLSGGLMLAGGLFFSRPICRLVFQSEAYAGLFNLTLWATFLTIVSEPFNLYLRFEERAKAVVSIAVLTAVVNIGVSFYCVVILRQGVYGLVLAALIGRLATLVLMAVPVVLAIRIQWQGRLLLGMLKMGIPLIPAFACLYVIQQAGKYVLQWKQGLDAVGIYQLGMSIGLFSNLIVSAFQSAWYPFFMSFMDRREDATHVFSRILTYYILGGGTLLICFFAAAKPLVMIMTQPQFADAYKVIGLTAAGIILQGLYYVLLPPMYFEREVQWQTPIQLAAAALVPGLSILLVRWSGVLGAALAFMAGYLLIVLFTLAWNWFRRRDYLRIHLDRIRVFSFTAFAVVLSGVFLIPRDWALPVEILAMGLALLATTAFIFLELNTREKAMMQRWIQNFFAQRQKAGG